MAIAFPKAVYLEITDQCNMACPMCITRHHRAGKRPEACLDLDQIREHILAPGRELGMKTLVISGGEPLMSPLLQDTITTAMHMGFRIYLATNLYNVSPGLLEWLVEELNAPWHTIQVSFDSLAPLQMGKIRGKNSFRQVHANIRRLTALRREQNSRVGLAGSIVMQPENLDTVCSTALFLIHGIGVDRVYVQQRHQYRSVGLDNFKSQPCYVYKDDELEQAMRTVVHLFGMAQKDSRIIPANGVLQDWMDFLTDPGRIQKPCTSSKLLFIDPYGHLRGCLHSRVIGNILDTRMADFFRSAPYQDHLVLQAACGICTHSGS